jgi:hypothetical protein
MKKQIFYNFEELLDFLRYVETGVKLTYSGQDDPNGSGFKVLVLEISEEDYAQARAEYEADTYTGYEYV